MSQAPVAPRIQNPDIEVDLLCKHVASGGTLTQFCLDRSLKSPDISALINSDKSYREKYEQAKELRRDWQCEALAGKLMSIADFDIGLIYNDDGTLRPVAEWPEHARASVAQLETKTSTDRNGEVKTLTHSVKLESRLKAVELAGRSLGMFQDKVEHTGSVSLADVFDKMEQSRGSDDPSESG